ncbi:hypothetical protein QR680_000955 [Steinernema hermaphroditum]|uniref:SXP/RAL-2 family protein Ani s 5-like cation-binding domain-containing protein n=1 Tax=Steinernema hermaphroditum TaxID=289476 RepID=A0AA39LF03_9BILA|nr:hypothetical protein QR680_000955 [Steinernema hermaphroditum]
MRTFTILVIFLALAAQHTHADWFDDFIDGFHSKIIAGADYIKEKAAPAVREKFNAAKETLQDPETHRGIQEWITEKAVPVVKEKIVQLSNFVNSEVVPEVEKIYKAGKTAADERAAEKKD